MRILIIAPYFAPSSEVPSVRMVSLSNYLVENGHDVSVMCWSREKLYTIYKENELCSSVPEGVKIIEFDSREKYLPFIDDIRFGKEMKKHLEQVLKKESFDILFVTCGPYFTLEALPYIKQKYQLPYVIDFRDLGALNYRPKLSARKAENQGFFRKVVRQWYRKRVAIREKKAVESADGIICVSQIDRDKMKEAYMIPDSKIVIATNGYDEKKLSTITPEQKEKGVTGAVFGKFMYYSKQRAVDLLKAIDKEYKSGVEIKLIHIGRTNDQIKAAIKENDIAESCYEARGLQEYSKGMAMLGSADFFVVEDTSPDDVGTKIYDYIYWNKPIIAAVQKDIPLAKLVSSFAHGYVCENGKEIETALRQILDNKYVDLDPRLDKMKYSRHNQNKVMEEMMVQVFKYQQ